MVTETRVKDILAAYREGKSIKQIVKELKVPIYWVYYALGQAGVKPKVRAKRLGGNVTAVRPIKGTLCHVATIPSVVVKELGLNKAERWVAEWSVVNKEGRVVQAKITARVKSS